VPSRLDRATGKRVPITYAEAVRRLSDLLVRHPGYATPTSVYACGQADYFALFALQECLRLLGVRNLSGNAEHCLNSGAVHNELLTGQEGPFITIDGAVRGPGRVFFLNGWNGLITHPGVFRELLARRDFDGWIVDVVETESARAVARRLGPERVLLVRSGSDPHLALAIGHAILDRHPTAVDHDFVARFADRAAFDRYVRAAKEERFSPARTAARIAPEPELAPRIEQAILDIAARLAHPDVVPINIPSVGLSQTTGVVAHCTWGDALALVGKYGLRPGGDPAGGTLRLPGQANAQTEVQALNRNIFFGRLPFTKAGADEAARRMGLPGEAYDRVLVEAERAVLDYVDPYKPCLRELILCLGTQFATTMIDRRRWIDNLTSSETTFVVIDPIPDPFSVKHADLIIPSPPHAAAVKLYQNGEWRFSLSVPGRRAAPETRTDATIMYDVMAETSRRLTRDAKFRGVRPDLARLADDGYLRRRFLPVEEGGGLPRVDGEVCRRRLWERVHEYLGEGPGGEPPLYCRPEHPDARPIEWSELLREGSLISGGVGTRRFLLDPADPDAHPFRDIHRRPGKFRFFVPTEEDLTLPTGIVLSSGRSSLSDEAARVRFAGETFNSGKHTPVAGMPDEHPLHVSHSLAGRLGLEHGGRARVSGVLAGGALDLPVEVTDRCVGDVVYTSFHKCRAELRTGRHVNDITSVQERCGYSAQTRVKATQVLVEPLPPRDDDDGALRDHGGP